MKNKKLLIVCIVVATLVAVVILMSALTSLSQCAVLLYDESGVQIAGNQSLPTSEEILEKYKGRNVVFLDKEEVLSELNKYYPQWHFIDIVKSFPNKIDVCITARLPLFTFSLSNKTYFLDSKGYVVSEESATGHTLISLDGVFSTSVTSAVEGALIDFSTSTDDAKLSYVLQSVSTIWRLYYDVDEISQLVVGFQFAMENNQISQMTIVTNAGARLVVISPEKDLAERILKVVSVYTNPDKDFQNSSTIITVDQYGNVKSNN